jgi:8-oxoguanine deaminase
MRLWIKSPLAIFADNAGDGVVIDDGRIAELVPSGAEPAAPVDNVVDASRYVVLPGLINTHHHMYQTLTRAHPDAINKELFPWLEALYPVWARVVTPESFRLATRLALTELMMSGCTTAADHHYLPARLRTPSTSRWRRPKQLGCE